jgi:LmbE family N-acetylglucosaminyl deacetylase
MSDPELARSFLARLAGDEPIPGDDIVVVVAHADDETIGLGAQLPRLTGITVVHVTDGAPRNLIDAHRRGFASAQDYAAARRRELEAAMALAGVPADALVGFDVPDQEAALDLAGLARRLADLIAEKESEILLTHSYEGGHPDHDATAFAVHAATRLLARPDPGRQHLIVEMPFYRAGPSGWAMQRFLPDPDHPELALWLSEGQRNLKQRMVAAHASQKDVLALFPIAVERFRTAPDYDFTSLPNDGDLLYERENWGMDGARWLDLVRRADAELAGAAA